MINLRWGPEIPIKIGFQLTKVPFYTGLAVQETGILFELLSSSTCIIQRSLGQWLVLHVFYEVTSLAFPDVNL